MDKLFAQALRSFQTLVPGNNRLLVALLESSIKLDERFKVNSVPFFFSDFNLLSYELQNITFKRLY